MSILEKIKTRQKVLKEIVEENEQYKEFIDIISKFLYKDNENVTARFSIGKRLDGNFISYLDSHINIRDLKVMLDIYQIGNIKEPLLIFKSSFDSICLINLLAVSNINITKEECDSFTRYTIYFTYKADDKTELYLDYYMNFLINN